MIYTDQENEWLSTPTKNRRVEKTKADTWAFVVFMVFMATVALLNG